MVLETSCAAQCDQLNDVEAVTKPINPGLRGLEDRKENFADYITAMATVDKAES